MYIFIYIYLSIYLSVCVPLNFLSISAAYSHGYPIREASVPPPAAESTRRSRDMPQLLEGQAPIIMDDVGGFKRLINMVNHGKPNAINHPHNQTLYGINCMNHHEVVL